VFEIHNFFAFFFRFLQNATVHLWNNTGAFTGMDYVGLYENTNKNEMEVTVAYLEALDMK